MLLLLLVHSARATTACIAYANSMCVCVCAVHAVPASCAPCAHIDSVIDIDVDYILFRWSSAWHTQNTQNAYTPAVREQTRNIRGELRPPIKMDYSHQRMCLGHERIFILCACLLWLAEVQLGQQNLLFPRIILLFFKLSHDLLNRSDVKALDILNNRIFLPGTHIVGLVTQ